MFDRFFGKMEPVAAVAGAAVVGTVAVAYLQGISDFVVFGPGGWRGAVSAITRAVPMLAAAAIAADLTLRYPDDMNVPLPDALRFYPAVAVFVEVALHAVPVAVLVTVFGMPTGLDTTFWRIAIPVALIEALLQAMFATSISTSVFSAVHLVVFGVAQVWMFWRFGFVWMLVFRLAYYSLWHVAWGAVRLELLF